MKFDVTVFGDDLTEAAGLAKAVEDFGFDGMWLAEAAHNPFLPLAHAALATTRISLGTAIAVAFPRAPLLMAETAWQLSQGSQGRFMLGLGTQIKPHITKRFGMPWGKPLRQLREYIALLRACWHHRATGQPVDRRGETYSISLPPMANEPQIPGAAEIPILIAGVNVGLARLAGELCDGFHVHSFHTPRYLRQVLQPAFADGRARGHMQSELIRSCAVFVVTGATPAELEESKLLSKSQIAFYASTPSYSRVLEIHGWGDLIPRLNALLRRGRWDELHQLISDDMLSHFAVIAPPDELPYKVRERYQGLLDRVGFYFPFTPGDASKRMIWDAAARAMR